MLPGGSDQWKQVGHTTGCGAPHSATMLENLIFLAIGIALWFAVATDAKRFSERTSQRIWGLSHRTWAWIVAITFVGLVVYAVARVLTSRSAPRAEA